jgi:hypothetical protein
VTGKLLDVVLGEGADHQPVEVAREDHGGVLQRLAAAELKIGGGEIEPHAAQLRDPHLERDARSRGRLLEDHPEGPTGEEMVLLAAALPLLQVVGEVEHAHQLLAAPGGHASEIAALQALGDGGHFRLTMLLWLYLTV